LAAAVDELKKAALNNSPFFLFIWEGDYVSPKEEDEGKKGLLKFFGGGEQGSVVEAVTFGARCIRGIQDFMRSMITQEGVTVTKDDETPGGLVEYYQGDTELLGWNDESST
jgi:hypothetical protein